MKEQLVSFKVAKLAKEKGFNEETYAFYDSTNTLINPLAAHKESNWTRHIILNKYNDGFVYNSTTGNKVNNYAAPTQSLLQKWLREKHNIVVFINPYPTTYAAVIQYNNREDKYATDLYDTYEIALEKGLEEALKLIDNESTKESI